MKEGFPWGMRINECHAHAMPSVPSWHINHNPSMPKQLYENQDQVCGLCGANRYNMAALASPELTTQSANKPHPHHHHMINQSSTV
jgi:hypothetical protein